MKAAVYTGSRALYADMVPAVKSLLINSDVERIFLLIEDDVFPEYLPSCVSTINVSGQTFFRKDGPNMGSRFTYMSMMRAALCHIFPELDRILSLDVDTIALSDISDVWEMPVEGYYFAAAWEPLRTKPGYTYTNTGVCLYNLEMLRDGKADAAIGELNRKAYRFLEQDVLNDLCQGRILDMPSEYNANEWVSPCRGKPKLIHYAGIRDWSGRPEIYNYRAIPWAVIRGGL